MDKDRIFSAFEVRIHKKPANGCYLSFFADLHLRNYRQLPVVVYVAEPHEHLVGYALYCLKEPCSHGIFGQSAEHLMFKRLILGSYGSKKYFSVIGQSPGCNILSRVRRDHQVGIEGGLIKRRPVNKETRIKGAGAGAWYGNGGFF